jgi:hypothetical protein
MACKCPDKPKKGQDRQTGKPCTNQPKAHVVEVKSKADEKLPAYKATPLDIYTMICLMLKAKQDKLLERLIDEGSGDEGKILTKDKQNS